MATHHDIWTVFVYIYVGNQWTELTWYLMNNRKLPPDIKYPLVVQHCIYIVIEVVFVNVWYIKSIDIKDRVPIHE